MKKVLLVGLAATLALCALGAAMAQEDDVFAFIPDGGRTLLESVSAEGLPEAFLSEIAKTDADPAGWRERIDTAVTDAAALDRLDDWQRDTLAHYLAANAPVDPNGQLPWDGRDMTLQKCQSCHIVTVVVTQSRTREAWLGSLNRPSHVEIALTDPEREALADYLVINGGIPIDLVPPELRAGGASY